MIVVERSAVRQDRSSGDVAPWYLYLVRDRHGCLYTGIATDVARRFSEHRENPARAAKFLRGRGPLRLEFERRIGSRAMALRVERRVKRLTKRSKEALVRDRPDLGELLDRLELDARPATEDRR